MDSDAQTRRVGAPPQQSEQPAPLSRGDFVGRYLVVEALGEGGMGFVYRAYDPELDRHVALKVLRPVEPGSQASQSGGSDRLLREAQAMARISHPNIVKVHDVGQFGNDVFLAMDLIEGANAKAWLQAQPRSWREVLRVFVLAGRGLAAAHSVALIHRDFKPENVLVAQDGDVYVTDFGLARLAGTRERLEETLEGDDTPGSSDRLESSLTRTGTVVGTPAYMAPEQHAGGTADPRSDQFGFCVALYEGLYGERPYPGKSLSDLVSEKMRSQIREAPSHATVPKWLRKIVLRGLRVDPGQRYLSMHALLRELDGGPRRMRRRLIAAATAVTTLLVIVAAHLTTKRRHEQLCGGASDELIGVWDGGTRGSIADRFEASGLKFWASAHETTQRVLDREVRGWAAMRTEACEATHVRGDQSQELLDLRARCLDAQLAHIGTLTQAFTTADPKVVTAAAAAVHAIPSLERCGDGKALSTVKVAEGDTSRVTALAVEIAAGRALLDIGDHSEARRRAEAAVTSAQSLGDRAQEAEAHLLHAELLALGDATTAAEHAFYRAIWAAEASRADGVGARAWVRLAQLAQTNPNGEASTIMEHASHAVDRAGNPPVLRAQLERRLGDERRSTGHRAQALEHYERALDLLERSRGSRHPDVADAQRTLGALLADLGDAERAVTVLLRGLAIVEDVYGPDHPRVAGFVRELGDALEARGKHEESRAHHDRADRIDEQSGAGR